MNKQIKKRRIQYCSQETALQSSRRVIRVAFKCLSSLKGVDSYPLMTDGKGLWTLGEILAHMEGALSLRVKR